MKKYLYNDIVSLILKLYQNSCPYIYSEFNITYGYVIDKYNILIPKDDEYDNNLVNIYYYHDEVYNLIMDYNIDRDHYKIYDFNIGLFIADTALSLQNLYNHLNRINRKYKFQIIKNL